jgi:undecaprenyl-phosphate 4-deoxy-4-formamido-L-arabinose transferase
MSASPLVSIVIPVFNEEENLEELVERCLKVCRNLGKPFEMLLVDDGSSDNSQKMITEAVEKNTNEVIGVFLNRNYGQHAAIMAGFAQLKGDICVTLDADLQNPPEEIPKLVNKVEEGFDVVGSIRMPRSDSLFRRVASSITNKFVQMSTGVMMNDYGCMLRAYNRSIINALLQCHERSSFIPVLANSFARNTTEIEVSHNRRNAGESKYSLWKLFNLQFDLLTSMTTFPIRFLSILGGIISISGMGLGLYILIMRMIYGTIWALEGIFTLFALLFIFIGAQFVGLGLIGEYIGRIYNDVRARPRYFVQNVIGTNNNESRKN